MPRSGRCQKKFLLSPFTCVFLLVFQLFPTFFLAPPLHGQDKHPVKIGVLAKRGPGQAMEKWSPTASYLNQALPEFTFEIIPLNFHDVRQAVADRTIDFIITNSAYYVHLEYDHGISRIATLKNLVNNVPERRFGGVIFTRADRDDIASFIDLLDKDFYAVDQDSFGGWQMAWREFRDHGIAPSRDFASLFFAGTHDKVVHAVLSGEADAGTVRTDTLERMAAEGKIDLADLKVIHPSSLTIPFSYLCSTRLYPEWPFAKLRHTPDSLAEKVSIALLSMPADSEAARAASLAGWTVPLDYQPVHELMQELHIGPYHHHLGPITLKDFFREHKDGFFVFFLLLALLLLCLSILFRLNQKLHQTKNALSEQLIKVQGAEKNYREIFDGTNEAIFVHDISDGAILDVNQAMCDMYGYSVEEAKKLKTGELSSGEYPYNHEEAARIFALTLTEGSKFFEWHAQKKDGTLFWVEVNLKPAIIGGHQRLLAAAHDITDRKKAEEELRRYRHRLEEMIMERTIDLQKSEASLAEAQRLAHLGSWEWHIDEGSLWWSDETYRIFGLNAEDSPVDHDSFLAAIHPDDRQVIEQAIDDALHGKPYTLEHRIVRPDGSIRIVQERGKTIFSGDHVPLRMVGSVQDITDRKKIEAEQQELKTQLNQAQKLEAIGTMAGGIAHDFNNILGAINGYTELALVKLGDNNEVSSHLKQVIKAGNRAKDLVNQILTFSRKEKLDRQPIAIDAIIQESLKLLRATIPTNIDVRTQIKTKGSKIMADPTQIHQIILNLCTNAHHAMEQAQEGFLNVELVDEEIVNQQAQVTNLIPGTYVKLTISDSGAGISPKNLERIFDPYFTTKEQGKGTGMGLSVVHGIVKSCDGVIIARSKEGEGSTFTIYFPKLAEGQSLPTAKGHQKGLQRGHEKILFVDDEPSLVELGQLILEHLGYQVTAVTNSLEALHLLAEHPYQFDVLITDQSMPKMTGCQLAKEAMAIRPDLPVILCSGYGSLMSQEDVINIGIKKFIRKPYDTAIISAVLRETLDDAQVHIPTAPPPPSPPSIV